MAPNRASSCNGPGEAIRANSGLLERLAVTRQLNDCRDLANRNGWQIVEEFEDNDISAAGGKKRPAYLRLKSLMEAGAVDVVVVYSADRLHRNPRELEDWIVLASKTGIGIHSATNGHLDLSNPDGGSGWLLRRPPGKSKRRRCASSESILNLPKPAPGHDRNVMATLPTPESFPKKRPLSGRWQPVYCTVRASTRLPMNLTARGIPTARGASWRAASIRNILMSPRIAGLRVHRGEVSAKGQWEGIVSEQTSMMLRTRFAAGRSTGPIGGPRKHLLTGLLVCSKCGTGMVKCVNGKSKKESYRCPRNVSAAACGGTTIGGSPTTTRSVRIPARLISIRARP